MKGPLALFDTKGDREFVVESNDPANLDACSSASGGGRDEYWRWCPRCGNELHNEKCKLRCPRCHYFMSCSDFD